MIEADQFRVNMLLALTRASASSNNQYHCQVIRCVDPFNDLINNEVKLFAKFS